MTSVHNLKSLSIFTVNSPTPEVSVKTATMDQKKEVVEAAIAELNAGTPEPDVLVLFDVAKKALAS